MVITKHFLVIWYMQNLEILNFELENCCSEEALVTVY